MKAPRPRSYAIGRYTVREDADVRGPDGARFARILNSDGALVGAYADIESAVLDAREFATRDVETPRCPTCFHDDVSELGTLGFLDWFRCRSCGLTFNVEAP